jgi:hypothetical protein
LVVALLSRCRHRLAAAKLPPTSRCRADATAAAAAAAPPFVGWLLRCCPPSDRTHRRNWRRKRNDLLVDKAWDKDVLLFKRWRSRRQPPPAVTTLCDGCLLRSLLSRRSSEHHQQLTNGSTILFTFSTLTY